MSTAPDIERIRDDLLRRLELAEREVEALAARVDPAAAAGPVAQLREMEAELRQRVAAIGDPAGWAAERDEIAGLWKRHRRSFEELAAAFRQRHTARPGRRLEGPRW